MVTHTFPDGIFGDPTLIAVDEKIVERESKKELRHYLGASQIGGECSRELWYSFRWAFPVTFDAATHKRFIDGHRDEELMAERLRLVPGLELWTIDPRTGYQFGISDIGGHFKGHLDGVVQGLLQAPKTIHVWEHKTANEEKQGKLHALCLSPEGEKLALKEWDGVYYAQAQIYMHYMGFKRHYLTCSSPGGRTQVSCRTEFDSAAAKAIIEKAKKIITAENPLDKISNKPEFYQCKWCSFNAVCHGGEMPSVNCRTCVHSTPEMDGDGRWSCAKWGADIPLEYQRKGCENHLYLPSLLPYKVATANAEENWIEYQKPDGLRFKNGDQYYSSEEIRTCNHDALGRPEIEEIKKPSTPDWLATNQNESQTSTGASQPWLVDNAGDSSEIPSATAPALENAGPA